ncbi:hypothetical protein GCM10027275_50770 [Rhabdobacter roseus]
MPRLGDTDVTRPEGGAAGKHHPGAGMLQAAHGAFDKGLLAICRMGYLQIVPVLNPDVGG